MLRAFFDVAVCPPRLRRGDLSRHLKMITSRGLLDANAVLGYDAGRRILALAEGLMKKSRYIRAARDMSIAFGVFLAVAWAQAPVPATGVRYAQISESDMKQWLSYLASDELQGRQVFTEGYGRASQYVADQLKSWGV